MATARARTPGVEARAGKFPGPSLIPALYAIQERVGWLPREELVALAREVHRPLYEIEGLISFYPHFLTEPPRRVTLHACRDLSCWLHGADGQTAALRQRYGPDTDVEFAEVSCIGRCDAAPAVSVNERPAAAGDAGDLVAAARDGGLPPAELPSYAGGRPWPNDPYGPVAERYGVLRAVLAGELGTAQIITALQDSGLRGMGGAGFPAGRKWDLVAAQEATPKYVICNADESEPGTFKDRQILAEQPHLVLEGMLLGMLAVGAEEGWVFIRHEYGPEEQMIRREIGALRAAGLAGANAGGSGRRLSVEVFTSPGGYVLGEESALIECMEGHRGEPRNKPPFPGTYGLWGKPTLMNSVETFAHVPVIARRGADWWKEQGAGEHTGLKFFAVSGHVERPGVYCVPMGTTARQLLELAGGVAGGRPLGAIQPGGASSNFLGPGQLDVPLDFADLAAAGSMLGSGAMVVMAEGTDLLAAATNVLRFFRDESCGKCVPCRVGSGKAHRMLSDLLAAGGGPGDVGGQIAELATVMRRTSICGLGQVALGPVMSVTELAGGAGSTRDAQHGRGNGHGS
ncbi:MAG TPA: NAD(P)H-dependent oxidoreductase subunit E [Streptosporangiaceae bacterium]|jgi:NADH:ubiquinone oxidoreductase subunit F (NADH-binding)/NADH:ubiquinone oxidoreductase subunit E